LQNIACSRVAANGTAPPGAEPSTVTSACRRAPCGAVRGQDPPEASFATQSELRDAMNTARRVATRRRPDAFAPALL
jgi:hypothetical protein